jgi:hypothetical protein
MPVAEIVCGEDVFVVPAEADLEPTGLVVGEVAVGVRSRYEPKLEERVAPLAHPAIDRVAPEVDLHRLVGDENRRRVPVATPPPEKREVPVACR